MASTSTETKAGAETKTKILTGPQLETAKRLRVEILMDKHCNGYSTFDYKPRSKPGRKKGQKTRPTSFFSVEDARSAGYLKSNNLASSKLPGSCLSLAKDHVKYIMSYKSDNVQLHNIRVYISQLRDITENQLAQCQAEVRLYFLPQIMAIGINKNKRFKIRDYFDEQWNMKRYQSYYPQYVRAAQQLLKFTEAKSIDEARDNACKAYELWSDSVASKYIQSRIVAGCMQIFNHFLYTHILERTNPPPAQYARLFTLQNNIWVMRNPQELLDTPTVWHSLCIS